MQNHSRNHTNPQLDLDRRRSPEHAALWTVRQSAAFLGYADGTVRNLIAKGQLPRVKLATGATRLPSDAVRAFAFGQKTKEGRV